MGEVVLTIAATPPSFNAVGHTGSRWKWTKEKKRWQEDIETALMVSLPRELYTFIEARAVLSFPTKRRRDEGNYRVLLEKCLGDALVNGGWLADDTPDQYRFHGVEFEHGEPRTQIVLS